MVVLAAAAAPAPAGDWPQWRGPNLNGSCEEPNLPASFTKTENLAWVVPLPGPSGSTPIVVAQRIFLTSTSARNDDLLAMCLDARDGQTVWSAPLAKGKVPMRGEITACSPASDGKTVFFLFGTGDMAAMDLAGNPVWTRELTKEFGCFALKFGYGASPLLLKGRLYLPLLRREKPYPYSPGAFPVPVGPLESLVICLDAATGKTLWKQVRPTNAEDESRENYATPMPVDVAKKTQIIIPGGEFVTAHDADTGKELWRWEYTKEREIWQRIVPSPVVGEGLVYVCQSQGAGLFALRPTATSAGTIPHDSYAWKFEEMSSDVTTPLLYRGLLYVLSEENKTLSCLDPKTGKVKWQSPFAGTGPWRASPTGADGKIYCISEGGDFVVLAAGEEKFHELYRFALGYNPCRSTIVAANGSLYLRLSKHLVCVRKGGAKPATKPTTKPAE
jgi:outer membrane protein assembly factor BamB